MKASIIITTFRRSDFLLRSVESALNQNFSGYEIIVIDDNGLDSDFQKNNEILLSAYISSKAIKYIALKENAGACNARNQGVLQAMGKYVLFLDDDDEYFPEKLLYQINFLDANSDYAAHVCAMKRIDKNGKEIISIENTPRGENFVSFAVDGNFFTPMMCIHKNIFLEIGGFDDTPRFQDQYFMNKMLFSGYKVKMDSIPLYKMYEHDNNRITNTSVEQSIRALNILKKYKFNHQERFNQEQWKQIEYNYLRQKAGILFVSNNYMSRIKAFILYIQLFIKKPSVYAIRMMFRTLIIVKCRG